MEQKLFLNFNFTAFFNVLKKIKCSLLLYPVIFHQNAAQKNIAD